jgi:hypothetical protein
LGELKNLSVGGVGLRATSTWRLIRFLDYGRKNDPLAGDMAKRVQKPKGFHVDGIADEYSVSGCINEDIADYIEYWKHNGHWLFDSSEIPERGKGKFD